WYLHWHASCRAIARCRKRDATLQPRRAGAWIQVGVACSLWPSPEARGLLMGKRSLVLVVLYCNFVASRDVRYIQCATRSEVMACVLTTGAADTRGLSPVTGSWLEEIS